MTRRWCIRNSVCSLCAPRLLSPRLWAGMLPLVAAHRQPASNELLAFRCEKHRLDTPAKSASTDGTVTQAEITTELAGPYCASKGRRNSALPNIIGEVSPLVKVPGIELNRRESGWRQEYEEGWQSAGGVSGLSLFSLRRVMFARESGGSGSYQLGQAIVRVVVIDGSGSDQFVFYKNGGGDWTLVQNIEADSNDVF